MSSELIKMYRVKQGIYSPIGNVKEGTESIYHQGYYAFPYIGRKFNDDKNGWLGNSFMTTDPSSMPEWFEEITQPKEETKPLTDRIKVVSMWDLNNIYQPQGIMNGYKTSKPIPEDKFPLIKQALESVLNDDVKKYDGKGRGKEWGTAFERLAFWGTHSGWRYCGNCKEPILKLAHFENMVDYIQKEVTPTYTQKQVDEMCERVGLAFIHHTEFKMENKDWLDDKGELRKMGDVYDEFISKYKNQQS